MTIDLCKAVPVMLDCPPRPVSYSAANKFNNCPLQYAEESVYKNYPFEDNEHTIRGKYVHKAIENYIKHGITLPIDVEHVKPTLDKYLAIPGTKWAEFKSGISPMWEPIAYFSKKIPVMHRATIDLMIAGEKVGVVVDHKTGKVSKFPSSQLKEAAVHMFVRYPKIETVVTIYNYTEHREEVREVVHRDKDLIPMAQEIRADYIKISRAVAEDKFPPNPNPLCAWCVVETCEFNEKRK